ncbi:MAG: hypothetical protein H7211_00885 [Aquabacterium sp.]|nr:hypothetical protein [Ferruginibacter sp.]
MNTKLLLIAITVAASSSCTTLYKAGQTPDDVYYSPVRTTYGEDRTERREEQRNEVKNYNAEDRSIRLGINDRRWRSFDNDYSYTPYSYGFNYGYYYNPYFWPYPVYNPVFINPSNPKNTTPRRANLGLYNPNYNGGNNTPNPKMNNSRPVRPGRTYNNNNGSAVGNVIRQIFTPDNNSSSSNNSNNNNSGNNNNTRTYTPATNNNNSSSGSSSSSSGGGGVTRPARTGGN